MLSCLRPALKKRKRYSAEGPDFVGSPAVVGFRPASDAPSSSSKRVRILKGKRCEHSFGTADPDVDRTPIQLPYHCDGCGNYILTVRHSCGECEDYDLCDACFRAYRDDEPGAPSHHTIPLTSFSSPRWTRTRRGPREGRRERRRPTAEGREPRRRERDGRDGRRGRPAEASRGAVARDGVVESARA